MGCIAAARGVLYMLSVGSREQQVAEKPYGEHLYTSYQIVSCVSVNKKIVLRNTSSHDLFFIHNLKSVTNV